MIPRESILMILVIFWLFFKHQHEVKIRAQYFDLWPNICKTNQPHLYIVYSVNVSMSTH